MTHNKFAKDMIKLLARTPRVSLPCAYYDSDVDSLEVLFTLDPYTSKRVDRRLFVFVSRDTGGVVGYLIQDITPMIHKLMEQVPGLKDKVINNKIPVRSLIQACFKTLNAASDSAEAELYRSVLEHDDHTLAMVRPA